MARRRFGSRATVQSRGPVQCGNSKKEEILIGDAATDPAQIPLHMVNQSKEVKEVKRSTWNSDREVVIFCRGLSTLQ
uniref:Uncharacterized protein n=1 Tax=Haemonchus contortus TaxID=6289 RepID=W6NE45_HAECO